MRQVIIRASICGRIFRSLLTYLLLFTPALLKPQIPPGYDSLINKLMAEFDTPGIAVAVLDNGEWAEYFDGVANIKSKQRITSASLFNVASLSKMVTSIAVMQLKDAGKIELDDPIEAHLTSWRLPYSKYQSSQVTIRRVLNHSGGLSGEFGPGFTPKDKLIPLVDILSGKSRKRESLRIVYKPGSKHMYSNLGFGLLQLLVEDVTHMPFEKYVEENIFQKIGMENSSFKDPVSKDMPAALVTPYSFRLKPYEQERFVVVSAAGLITNLKDLELLLWAEVNKDMLISEQAYTEMHHATSGIYALGHINARLNDKVLYTGHTGLGMGWNASFQFSPNSKDGIVVLTNGENGTYIHNTLVCNWIYAETGARIKACNVAPNKKLNWVEYFLEISLDEKFITNVEHAAFEKQLLAIRQALRDNEIHQFAEQCLSLQATLNKKIDNTRITENFNGAFESIYYWLDMPWFANI